MSSRQESVSRRGMLCWIALTLPTLSAGFSRVKKAEPKWSTPRSRGKACCHLSLGKQVEKGDQKVGSAINAWGLLESAMKATGRNRRVSNTLSPIFYLFLAPSGKLYLKVQHLLAGDELVQSSDPPLLKRRRPGPKHPDYGIPTSSGRPSCSVWWSRKNRSAL